LDDFGGDDSDVLFPGNVLETEEGFLSYHVGGDGGFQGVNDEDIDLGMFLGFFYGFDSVSYLCGHAHVCPSVSEIYGVLVQGEVGHIVQAFVQVIHIGIGGDEEHLPVGFGGIEGNLAEGFQDIGEGCIGNDVYLAFLEGEGINVFILDNGAFWESGTVLVVGRRGDYGEFPTGEICDDIGEVKCIIAVGYCHQFPFVGEEDGFLAGEDGEGLVFVVDGFSHGGLIPFGWGLV